MHIIKVTSARLVAVLALLTGAAAPVSAPVPGAPDGPAFSLSITPTRLVLPAGELAQPHLVKVSNLGREPVEVEVGKRDFVQRPDGSLLFAEHAPYSASTWVEAFPARFSLAAGASTAVQIRVKLPDDPDVGDHQVAMVFLVAADSGSASIRVNRGLGMPVYLTVPGSVDDSMQLDAFKAPGFALSGPLRVSATIRSIGTVHKDFKGPESLKMRVADRSVPFPDFTVTRGAARDVAMDWDPPLACICHATLAVRGADGTVQELSARIVVMPLHLFAGVLVGALLLFFAVRFARRRYRVSVRRAAQAMRRNGNA